MYNKWKGINYTKKYVIPGNPNSEGQQDQRDYLKEANLAYHIDGYTILDNEAWNLYAKNIKALKSGYNCFLGFKIDTEKESKTWTKLNNCIISDVIDVSFKVNIKVASNKSGILYLGELINSMKTEFPGVFSVDHYTFTVTGLTKGKKYFFYIKNTSVNENARTGIYYQKTGEAPPPIIIDIGNPAIDRSSQQGGNITVVDRNNPANASGVINTIEIYCPVALYLVEVATFYVVSGNNLTTRDNVLIGNIGAGKTTKAVSLNVVAGDRLGIYWQYSFSKLVYTEEACAGIWWTSGDKIPCINQAFDVVVNYKFSIHGIGLG